MGYASNWASKATSIRLASPLRSANMPGIVLGAYALALSAEVLSRLAGV